MSSQLMKETKYLKFYYGKSDSGKTVVVKIVSINPAVGWLGEVKWFSRWRQYAFFPYEGTVWNRECMADVTGVIDRLMEDRRLVRSGVAVEVERGNT